MNQAVWEDCNDARKMLEWIRRIATDRKLRLFACAFWKWDHQISPQPAMIDALIFAESWAETGIRPNGFPSGFKGWHPLLARSGFDAASWTVRGSPFIGRAWIGPQEESQYVKLLQEIFGNPFRPIGIDPMWLTRNDAKVVRLAHTIYDERRFDLMPILADALEEAGCGHGDILTHCRGTDEHVRGCWVVDLLLGKA